MNTDENTTRRQVTLRLRDPIGIEFTVTVPEDKMYDAMRHYGAKGCTSGEVPPGGYRLPLANEEDFDWRLIGARKFMLEDNGERIPAVYHRGFVYKRRELEANTRRNLKKIIKYSRGAKAIDDDRCVEGEGDFRYVTLITFAGENALRDERYALPARATPR